MFKRSDNRAVLHLRIETVTPLRIGAGATGLDPVLADLTCVRTVHGRVGRTVYVPGSSLKGVVRSAAEASVRGRALRRGERDRVNGACDPLDHKHSCGGKYAKESESTTIYAGHCAACRTFGSTAIKGRASIRDLFPFREDSDENTARANAVEVRNGVAINRISGAVQHGPFDTEVVPPGVSFYGEVALENYQTWQLGLIAAAFDELNEGFAQLGSAKSRGLGAVRVSVERVVHDQSPGKNGPLDVASFVDDGDAYGLLRAFALPSDATRATIGLRERFTSKGEKANAWLEAGLVALSELLVTEGADG